MTFVWAHGQSGKEFYKDDELKYHGRPKETKVITRGSKGKIKKQIILVSVKFSYKP